jgi:cytochrome d ubiquinol oxidase subunit I
VAVGSNLSAVWILIANAWMQHPVGMNFNPDSARFEMTNFFDLFSPVAFAKFTHATSSSFMVGSLFVIAVSSWYLLQGRHLKMAKRSILVASVFGLLGGAFTGLTGDESAHQNAQDQPMKLAAFEGLYQGERQAGLVVAGLLRPDKQVGDAQDPFLLQIKVPGILSFLANRDLDSFVPGIKDLIVGNPQEGIVGVEEKMVRGRLAVNALQEYKQAQKTREAGREASSLQAFKEHQEFLGYGHLQEATEAVPPVALTFYAFHLMVMLWGLLMLFFGLFLYFSLKNSLVERKVLLLAGTVSFILALLASQAGWVVAEVGRQPWAIQGLLPVSAATSNIAAHNVQTTFAMFCLIFTLLLIAEVKIMLKQIHIGPEEK